MTGRRVVAHPDVIRRGPLAGLRWTDRARRIADAAVLVSGSLLGAISLLVFINLIPALAR